MNVIKDSWDKGIVQVLPVHGAQGYVTKYILKFDNRDHIVKPFSLISHGLGASYLSDQMIQYHQKNLIPYAMKPGGYRISLPRYYKDKIFTTYQKLLMKKEADMYRRDFEIARLANIDLRLEHGVNPFKQSIYNYQQRLYNAMKIYKEKKKL